MQHRSHAQLKLFSRAFNIFNFHLAGYLIFRHVVQPRGKKVLARSRSRGAAVIYSILEDNTRAFIGGIKCQLLELISASSHVSWLLLVMEAWRLLLMSTATDAHRKLSFEMQLATMNSTALLLGLGEHVPWASLLKTWPCRTTRTL